MMMSQAIVGRASTCSWRTLAGLVTRRADMRMAMLRKALWYAMLCGFSAMMPEVIAAIANAEAVSQVSWLEILDEKGILFLTAALGGLGIGGAKAGIQGRPKPPSITPVTLAILLLAVPLAGCGARYSITRVGPDGTQVTASAAVSEKQGMMAFTFEGNPAGDMTITLEKENVEPVNMPADTLQSLLKMASQ